MTTTLSSGGFQQTIGNQPPLSREEELILARAWIDEKSDDAAEKLVRSHLRYVVATATKYRRYGVPVGDLVAEGNLGLVHALRKFDPERGFRFVTYASYWIRAYILNHIIRSWSVVPGSGALRSKTFFKLRRERTRVANLVGDPEEAEKMLAERMGVSPKKLRTMLGRLESRDVSLDVKAFDDSSTTLLDTLVADDVPADRVLDEREQHESMRELISKAISNLDDRERYIVQQRLMADTEDQASLAEIGRKLGVSRERARQLESRAKGKLKSYLSQLKPDFAPDWLTPDLFAAAEPV
jgi:RNA polymerase sigma-32 factor